MPIIENPVRGSDLPWGNGHLDTIYPVLFRRPLRLRSPESLRLPTPDGDELDVDHYQNGARRLCVISHGLEGNSRRKYVLGMAQALLRRGWDVLTWNFRSCGGRINHAPRTYHSGVTDDLNLVLRHGLDTGGYDRAALVGFSMGGNQVLKLLGEAPDLVPDEVVGAVAVSVPCDLTGAALRLAEPGNRLYMRYFLRTLCRTIRAKHRQYPNLYPLEGLENIRTFREFDDRYTAPVNGFENTEDYWTKCASLPLLEDIRLPTLIFNAANDPFLSPSCYPYAEAHSNPMLFLEVPMRGGHVGFQAFGGDGERYSEKRTAEFLDGIDR